LFALTLDPDAEEYALELFGQNRFQRVTNNENLAAVLPDLFRSLNE
jgi:nitric oxide reductase activation protein